MSSHYESPKGARQGRPLDRRRVVDFLVMSAILAVAYALDDSTRSVVVGMTYITAHLWIERMLRPRATPGP